MKMIKNLEYQQISDKIDNFATLARINIPSVGWIKAIRTVLGISLEQLGNKLGMTKQGIKSIEVREKDGSITIKSLQDVGRVLDMKFVYGFVPLDGSLEALIDRKARVLAEKIVSRSSQTMKLEDQENSNERLQKAIDERVVQIKNEMPGSLWD